MPHPGNPDASPRPSTSARIVAQILRPWRRDPPVCADQPPSRRRSLYAAIGDFLFEHDLDLTPLNFGCAHDYLSGGDQRLVGDVDAALDRRAVSNAWIEDYVEQRQSHAVTAEMMVAMAAKVENELDRCLGLMSRSAECASGYSESLRTSGQQGSPEETMARLAELTRAMIEQTRRAEVEMRDSHSQVSQLRTTLRAARKASEIDHLTGLPNRRAFERRATELCAAHAGRPVAIALCDIDHFKAVNDRFGHDTGDRVLKSIAGELRALKRRGCEVARLGGEEFVVLLPDRVLEEAGEEMNRPRVKLAGRSLIDSVTERPIGTVTFSAGIAMIEDRENLKRAMRMADAALYAAKHAGRNRIYGAFGEGQLVPMHD